MINTNFKKMRIYFQLGYTDMRKSINTLSLLVQDSMKLNPFDKSLFVFCNKRKRILKILYWNNNGFCLWQKSLEKDKFNWPKSAEEIIEINYTQLCWFLNGLDFSKAYKKLNFSSV